MGHLGGPKPCSKQSKTKIHSTYLIHRCHPRQQQLKSHPSCVATGTGCLLLEVGD